MDLRFTLPSLRKLDLSGTEVLVAGLAYAAPFIGADAASALYWLVAAFLGFEAPAIRRDALSGRGWVWRGDLISSATDLAERDYLSHRP